MALLKFCELILRAFPSDLNAKALQEDVSGRKDEEFESSLKFKGFVEKVRSTVVTANCVASNQHIALKRGDKLKVIEVIDHKRKNGIGRLQSIQVLYPKTVCSGICLTFFSSKSSELSFRVSKLSVAKKLAEMSGLPEPTLIPDWPILPVQISALPVPTPEVLKLATGVNVPFGDLLDFLRQYKTAGTNSF